MSDRHEKWVRVEPGTVIPAGQPRRREFSTYRNLLAAEQVSSSDMIVPYGGSAAWFVDSSWKPPLELPTQPTWGIVVYGDEGGDTYLSLPLCCALSSLGRLEGIGFNGSTRGMALDEILDFIPLTPEQVARIEAAR